MDLKSTRRISTGKKILGISLIGASLLITLLMIVSPKIIARGVFGVFGFFSIIILALMLLIGVAVLKNARYTYPVKYLVYLGMVVFSVFSILHLIFANKFLDLNYGAYAKAMFSNFSAGGIVLGSPCFLLTKIIYRAGAYVFFIILGTIFTALLIDIKHAEKQFKRLSSRNKGEYLNYEARERGQILGSEEERLGIKQPKNRETEPVLVSLSNSNFRRPVTQPNNTNDAKIISREQQKSEGTTRAEQALMQLGLQGENSKKIQNDLVKKQLQDYITTPSSIQVEPVIKDNKNDNSTVINDNSINEASRAYQNAFQPAKRVYDNVPKSENITEQNSNNVTPIRNNRFNRETPPTIEPLKTNNDRINTNRNDAISLKSDRAENIVSSESRPQINLNSIESIQSEKRSIKD